MANVQEKTYTVNWLKNIIRPTSTGLGLEDTQQTTRAEWRKIIHNSPVNTGINEF